MALDPLALELEEIQSGSEPRVTRLFDPQGLSTASQAVQTARKGFDQFEEDKKAQMFSKLVETREEGYNAFLQQAKDEGLDISKWEQLAPMYFASQNPDSVISLYELTAKDIETQQKSKSGKAAREKYAELLRQGKLSEASAFASEVGLMEAKDATKVISEQQESEMEKQIFEAFSDFVRDNPDILEKSESEIARIAAEANPMFAKTDSLKQILSSRRAELDRIAQEERARITASGKEEKPLLTQSQQDKFNLLKMVKPNIDELQKFMARNKSKFGPMKSIPAKVFNIARFNDFFQELESLQGTLFASVSRGIYRNVGNLAVQEMEKALKALGDPSLTYEKAREALKRVKKSAQITKELSIITAMASKNRPLSDLNESLKIELLTPEYSDVPLQTSQARSLAGLSPLIQNESDETTTDNVSEVDINNMNLEELKAYNAKADSLLGGQK